MSRQWVFGWVTTVALLLTMSVAACQPITASSARMGVMTAAQAPADDPSEVNKAAVRAWFDAINGHDLAALEQAVDKYYAPDYVLHDPTVPNFAGGAATIKKMIRESMQAMPDAHLVINDLIAEGDTVTVRATATGTQPDGKPLTFFTMSVIHFVNGQFAEEWELAEPVGEEVVGSENGHN